MALKKRKQVISINDVIKNVSKKSFTMLVGYKFNHISNLNLDYKITSITQEGRVRINWKNTIGSKQGVTYTIEDAIGYINKRDWIIKT